MLALISRQGKGIDKNRISKIFDRYYRADPGSPESGMGLGLFISYEIIKQHAGEIGVQSKLRKGSTFWFTIPI
ncbi:sensor histidine kinase [Desertivirga arenae]|uniref:sensor histidine kinase n=1 Tax=Desertivirga arenae TaxID=2810309 RepID=UPI001A960EC7